jgi:hypothetical protein
LLLISSSLPGICQDRPERTARITITAVDGFGSELSSIKVNSFVDEEGHEMRALFHGPTASEVPFGKYRITLASDSSYYPTTFDVDVEAAESLITAAFEWGGLEGRVAGQLSGRLAGFPPAWSDWWCKASGLYLRLEYESAVPPGIYLLACVANKKYVVLRTIRINGASEPFTVDYKPGDGGEAVEH